MQFEVKKRFGGIAWSGEIECNINASLGVKLGLAICAAIGEEANLREADLRWADLSEANLRWADLSWADLRWANLREADLSWADLSEANLREANLREADLYGANLYGADLRWADLYGADLRWADLSWANLREANLREADLYGANLLASGNRHQLKTMQIDTWNIGYTHDTLQIGCQRHVIEKWRKWNTPAGRKWIERMDGAALGWADKHLDLVLAIIDASPAEK